MHGGAIVPHEDVAGPPGVAICGLRPGRGGDELGDVAERPAPRAYSENFSVEVETDVRFPGVRADGEGFRREPFRPSGLP